MIRAKHLFFFFFFSLSFGKGGSPGRKCLSAPLASYDRCLSLHPSSPPIGGWSDPHLGPHSAVHCELNTHHHQHSSACEKNSTWIRHSPHSLINYQWSAPKTQQTRTSTIRRHEKKDGTGAHCRRSVLSGSPKATYKVSRGRLRNKNPFRLMVHDAQGTFPTVRTHFRRSESGCYEWPEQRHTGYTRPFSLLFSAQRCSGLWALSRRLTLFGTRHTWMMWLQLVEQHGRWARC